MNILGRIRKFRSRMGAKGKAAALVLELPCDDPRILEVDLDDICQGCGDTLDAYSTIYRFTTSRKVRDYCCDCGMIRRIRLIGLYRRSTEHHEFLARLNDPSFFQVVNAERNGGQSRDRGLAALRYIQKRSHKMRQRNRPRVDIKIQCDLCRKRINVYQGGYRYASSKKEHFYCGACIGLIIHRALEQVLRGIRKVPNAPYQDTHDELFKDARKQFYASLTCWRWDEPSGALRFEPYASIN